MGKIHLRVMLHTCLATLALALWPAPAQAIDPSDRARARAIVDDAIAYLRSVQHESGAWAVPPSGSHLPAITGLVTTGFLLDPRIDQTDPAVRRAVAYMLSHRQPDGGIYDAILPSYNTAICLSALALVRTPEAAAATQRGTGFLRGLQYTEGYAGNPTATGVTEPVGREHPFYGGVGYGRNGRPDLSNLSIMLQGMRDSGVASDDPAFQRALTFLARTQMVDDVNDMSYADDSSQGGFVYATVPNLESVDGRAGQSHAGTIEETDRDGRTIVRLRAYGSMTYAGFKSLIYADLPRDDPRLVAAWGWIERYYTLDENPGMGSQGFYYYLVALARALDAWGAQDVAGNDWRVQLIDRLESLQSADGSFTPLHDRWMESDRVLITAYALVALQHALR